MDSLSTPSQPSLTTSSAESDFVTQTSFYSTDSFRTSPAVQQGYHDVRRMLSSISTLFTYVNKLREHEPYSIEPLTIDFPEYVLIVMISFHLEEIPAGWS
jgi:hypothetical protein